MRDQTPWLLAVALVLTAAVLAAAVTLLLPGDAAAEAIPYRWRETRTVSGVVLRIERLLGTRGGEMYYCCADGRRVAAGEPLGVIADTGEAYFRGRLLLRLENERAAPENGALSDAALSDEVSRIRSALSRADRDAAAGDAEGLAARLFPDALRTAALEREIDALRAAGAGDVILTAPASGFFLRSTDGWEGLYDEISAAALEAVTARGSEPTSAAGRLVTGSAWRLGVLADAADAALFTQGTPVRLEIGGRVFEAELTGRFPGRGGRTGLLFTGRTGLEALLNERFVEVTAVLAETDGLLIPAEALREEDGETVVYRPSGRFARRERVTVLARTADGVLVRSDALRAGSRVLLGGRWADGDPVRLKEYKP